jgi:hypothetical protein
VEKKDSWRNKRGGEEQKYIKITITVEQTESVSKITKKSMLLSM